MKKHRLSWHIAYLAGPMDRCPEGGKVWRVIIKEFLWKLGIGVIDPCDKPTELGRESQAMVNTLDLLKQEGKYEEVEAITVPIISVDYAFVDRCDFVIMYIDTDIHMCGSYAEETLARFLKKPVIICCKQGKSGVPGFAFKHKNSHTIMFGTWKEVRNYIKHIAFDSLDQIDTLSDRWKFLDYEKIYGRTL